MFKVNSQSVSGQFIIFFILGGLFSWEVCLEVSFFESELLLYYFIILGVRKFYKTPGIGLHFRRILIFKGKWSIHLFIISQGGLLNPWEL